MAAQQSEAAIYGRAGVYRVVGDGHPPSADPAAHAGQAVHHRLSCRLSGSPVSGQERRFQEAGKSLGQERASLHRLLDGIDPVLSRAVGQPADMRSQQIAAAMDERKERTGEHAAQHSLP